MHLLSFIIFSTHSFPLHRLIHIPTSTSHTHPHAHDTGSHQVSSLLPQHTYTPSHSAAFHTVSCSLGLVAITFVHLSCVSVTVE